MQAGRLKQCLQFGLAIAALIAGTILTAPPSWAEDVKGRWYFGGNLSFLSTTDSIRSNAGLFIGPFGDDGLPGTADPNEALSCDDTGAFCDPRPDDLLGRETTIEETFRGEITAGFGLSSWLSLQLDMSYFKGNVGPVDFFITDVYPTLVSNQPGSAEKKLIVPTQVGELIEIPVSLTAIARFRKDSTLNPYVGIGFGAIFTELNQSPDVSRLNDRLAQLRIKNKTDEFNNSLLTVAEQVLAPDGRIPVGENFLTTKVDDALEWHLMGGGEYFFSDRVSMVFDAKYTFADQDLQILLGKEDQVNFGIFAEELFRTDGSVKFFDVLSGAPNPLCVDSPNAPIFPGPGQGSGCPTTATPTSRVQCVSAGTVGDFDGDGVRPGDPDICYSKTVFQNDPFDGLSPEGQVVVQGGKIDLTGFSVALGVRFHF